MLLFGVELNYKKLAMEEHNMVERKYQQRVRLRWIMAHIGKWAFIGGFIILVIGLVGQRYTIAAIGQASLYFGATSIVIFSRIGWSKSLWKDILLNQVSIVVTVIGFGILFLYAVYGFSLPQLGVFAVVTGLILAVLGIVSQSSIPE